MQRIFHHGVQNVTVKVTVLGQLKLNLKIYDGTDWQKNNCNAHIAEYLKI